MLAIVKHRSAELKAVARQLNLSPEVVSYCLEAELVEQFLSQADLAELRRVRRLQELEVNLAGVEIILRMRRRIVEMQAEMEAMAAEIAAVQAHFERQLRDTERHAAEDWPRPK